MNSKLAILVIIFLIVNGCSSTDRSSYYYAQKQLEHNQVNFHNSLRINEYVNAFPQDWLKVKDGNEVILRVDKLTPNTPKIGEHSIVQIAVKTRNPSESELAEPIAISFVIDVSGSMGGEYITDTKLALIAAIQELNNGDRASIVTFNSSSQVIASNVTIDNKTRFDLTKKVETIGAGGGTNIESGLIEGYKEMAKFPSSSIKRILMLTDGQSNVNTHTPKQIASKAKVGYLEGARISTIGLGLGVNEKLLREIAKEGRGHYYFADTSKTLTKILREDLQSTIIPVGKNVKLNLNLGSGYKLVELYGGNIDGRNLKRNLELELGELNVNDWRIVIADIKRETDQENTIKVTGTYFSVLENSVITFFYFKRHRTSKLP